MSTPFQQTLSLLFGSSCQDEGEESVKLSLTLLDEPLLLSLLGDLPVPWHDQIYVNHITSRPQWHPPNFQNLPSVRRPYRTNCSRLIHITKLGRNSAGCQSCSLSSSRFCSPPASSSVLSSSVVEGVSMVAVEFTTWKSCKMQVVGGSTQNGRLEEEKLGSFPKIIKNLDVFPGIWIIIWDLLLNLVMSMMTLCSLIFRCPVKVLQSPASIVRSWRQSSTHTESWTTSSGRNLLSVQIGLSEVLIVLIQQSFWPSIGLELATSRHLSKVFPSSNHLILPLFRTQLGTVSRVSAKEAKENLCTHPVEHSQIQTCHAYWPFFHRPTKDRAWFLRKELVRSPKRNIFQTSFKRVNWNCISKKCCKYLL